MRFFERRELSVIDNGELLCDGVKIGNHDGKGSCSIYFYDHRNLVSQIKLGQLFDNKLTEVLLTLTRDSRKNSPPFLINRVSLSRDWSKVIDAQFNINIDQRLIASKKNKESMMLAILDRVSTTNYISNHYLYMIKGDVVCNFKLNVHNGTYIDKIFEAIDVFNPIIKEEYEKHSTAVNTIEIPFEVDEEFKPACKQYLIYFAQFLQDLGVEAKSSIIDIDSKQFLLEITPEHKDESLRNIHEALKIYLKIPLANDLNTIDISNFDIAAIQAVANAQHLKAQLTLSLATIKSQEKTIITLEQAAQNMTIPSLNKEDSEKLIPGVIDVTDVKIYGAKIKLPEILRQLKRRIRR